MQELAGFGQMFVRQEMLFCTWERRTETKEKSEQTF